MSLGAAQSLAKVVEHHRRGEQLDSRLGFLLLPIDQDLVDNLYTLIAYLARNGGHDWSEALRLPLRELYRRFDAVAAIIEKENDQVRGA